MRNKFLYQNLPFFAPPGMPNSGVPAIRRIETPLDQEDGGSGNNRNQDTRNGNDDNADNDSNPDDEQISLDPDRVLSELFTEQEETPADDDDDDGGEGGSHRRRRKEDGDNDDSGDGNADAAAAAKAFADEINQDIANITLAENHVPENFDPADRGQLQNLLQNTTRSTVTSTLRVASKMFARIMQNQRDALLGEIDTRITSAGEARNERERLVKAIPEAADPTLAPMVQMLFDTAKKRHSKPSDVIMATRRSLQALGIKLGAKPTGQNGDTRVPMNTEGNTGLGLEAFFPGSTKRTQNPSQVQRRMRREGR